MTVHQGTWVRRLRVEPDARVEPVCSPAVLEPAIAQLGADAVDWAVRLGHDIAVRCVDVFPEFGKGPAQVATVRWGTESAAIIAMRVIDSGELVGEPMTEDTARAIQDYVHRGIALPVVWAAVRQGHAWLAEAYMRACVDVVSVADQPAQLQHASEALFGFIDKFSDDIGHEYGAEHERWVMTTVAAREEVVTAVLAGTCTDVRGAEQVLHYVLAHRTHLGLILWFDRPATADDSALHKIALALLHAAGAEQTLIMPHGLSSLYAWGNSIRALEPDQLKSVLDANPGIRGALGSPRRGLDGFVRTHEQAREARAVADALPGVPDALVSFDEVRLLTLLVHDMDKARRFVDDVLGELAADDPHIEDLRKTAAAYLRLKRSPLAVANELYVVRNTVSYRLKKAEDLLGHSLDEYTLETWVALVLKDNMGITDSGDVREMKKRAR
ncbi:MULTISPECIES: CdaR family transcriptional regulator [Rhodococcus]|uniref:PucR family transcriptional regulator n=1 Tax=Rhodococcus TaxID=1827 RepID=UPI000C9CA983|nr:MULTISPECIES: helix-turn-helix domain-containing protein [Rhodococcus]PND51833.1 hypothetical protein CQZ88_11735 [Rhodococcus sp. ENV425]WKX00292.1 helix-turn-helix domain-containing protein [Rhodococcus aetherivorans]